MTSKWAIVILAILGIITILYFTGRKSVHHEIMINASPELVWSVLTDMDKYDEWNPVMKLIEGEVSPGNRVTYLFTQDEKNQSEIPATVKQVVSNELLNQSGGMTFILTYDHKYVLESVDSQTRVTIHEDYRGIGVNFWNPAAVEKAYGRLNKALKERAEKLNETTN